MIMPLQITFRNTDRSDAIELDIQERVLDLREWCGEVTSCRVVVEKGHGFYHSHAIYHVHIDMTVPGDEIVVSRLDREAADPNPHRSVGKAFEAARRRLKAYLDSREDKDVQDEP